MLFGIKQFVAIAVLQRCVSEIPPIINIASLFSESASQDHIKETALQIDSALREYGVFVAVGHNITEKMIGSSATAIRELFSLEQNAKESVSLKNTKAFGRGFLGFGEESGLSEFFEPKEGFSYGYPRTASKETEIVPFNLLQCENHFPISLSSQSITALNDMYLNKVVVVKAILRALSLFFDLHSNFPSDFLRNLTSEGETISLMRLFHYFNVQSETVQSRLKAMERVQGNDKHVNSAGNDDENADVATNHSDNYVVRSNKQIIGSSPHTDWGLLTLILQDNVGGLQFRHKNTWRDVTPSEANRNGIIVNGGDYLSLITNGRYHSPIHRVLSPGSTVFGDDSLGGSDATGVRNSNGGSNDNGEMIPGIAQETSATPVQSDRYSMVFFYYPNYNSSLDSNEQYSFGPVHDDVNSINDCRESDTSNSNDNDNICSAGNEGSSVDSTNTDHTAELNNHKVSSSDSSDSSGSGDAGDESINYNTLTVASDIKHAPTRYNDQAPGEEKLCFGDYIIKKWQDVNRT